MAITADHALAILYRLNVRRLADNKSLALVLEEFLVAKVDVTADGRFVISVSTGGSSFSFATPSGGEATQADIAGLSSKLMASYSRCRNILVSSGVAAPTDDQVFAEMLDDFEPVTSYSTDHSMLRYA